QRPACSERALAHCALFNDAATTARATLSLHDALPISVRCLERTGIELLRANRDSVEHRKLRLGRDPRQTTVIARRLTRLQVIGRSEEHTSELQSQSNLVCRLLLEKKNQAENEYEARQR